MLADQFAWAMQMQFLAHCLAVKLAQQANLRASNLPTLKILCKAELGLLLGTEAPVITPNSVDFSFFFL